MPNHTTSHLSNAHTCPPMTTPTRPLATQTHGRGWVWAWVPIVGFWYALMVCNTFIFAGFLKLISSEIVCGTLNRPKVQFEGRQMLSVWRYRFIANRLSIGCFHMVSYSRYSLLRSTNLLQNSFELFETVNCSVASSNSV